MHPVAVWVLAAVAVAGTTAVTAAAVNGAPSQNGILFANHGTVMITVGFVDWTSTFQPSGNGTQIFSDELLAFAYDITGINQTLTVDFFEQGYGWSNSSVNLVSHRLTQITLTLAGNPNWRSATVSFDTYTNWTVTVATPYSLLPLTSLNVGGLDLLVLTALYLTMAVFVGLTALARVLQRRGLWAPTFSLVVWGHVFAFFILATVLLDYQAVDRTFAGWSPLVYPFAAGPLWFVSVLSHYNSATDRLYLQAVPRSGSGMGVRLEDLLIAKNRDGDTVACNATWGGWLSRVFGKYAVLEKAEPLRPEGFVAEVESARPFKVLNPRKKDPITEFGLLKIGARLEIDFPHLTVHRVEQVPRVTLKDGSVVDAHERRRLSWPHYTEAKVVHGGFASAYATHLLAVASEWAGTEYVVGMLETAEAEVMSLKAGIQALATEKERALFKTFFGVLDDVANEPAEIPDDEVEGPDAVARPAAKPT